MEEYIANREYRILVVDDDEAFLYLVNQKLPRIITCSIKLAASFQAAKSFLEQEIFDLIICDYSLDCCTTGIELFTQTKQFIKQSPSIMVSCLEEPQIFDQAINVGFKAMLLKSEKFFTNLEKKLKALGFKLKL